jgi:hypothetical protein
MGKRTILRTVYMHEDLDNLLVKCAEQQCSSASRLVRIALKQFLIPSMEKGSTISEINKAEV